MVRLPTGTSVRVARAPTAGFAAGSAHTEASRWPQFRQHVPAWRWRRGAAAAT